MLIVDAIVVLALITGLVMGIRGWFRWRTPLVRERESRAHQIKVLEASRNVGELLLLDEDVALRVYSQLEEQLRRRGRLPSRVVDEALDIPSDEDEERATRRIKT